MKKEEYDIFVNYTIYPSADSLFNVSLLPVEQIKESCTFVFDTNALLLPYSTGSESLKEIKKVLNKLKEQKRLIIPGQVAREFANNRPEKLKEIFKQLNRKQSSVNSIGIGNYPLLEEIDDYRKAIEFEKEINEKLVQYRKVLNTLVEQVKQWAWNDPVSLIYQNILTREVILDIEIDRNQIRNDLDYRYLHKIPPGFKDEGKNDDGIGDLIIWKTILEIAKSEKDVIFVSGDEKNDWYHRSEKQALYPRFELIAEYQTHSKGKTFHIIRLSELLNILGADEKAVKEVEIEENIFVSSSNNANNIALKAERAVFEWLNRVQNLDVKINKQGFPDFEVYYTDGIKEGVEVLLINEKNDSKHSFNRIKQSMLKVYFGMVGKQFDKLTFVIVARNTEYNFNILFSYIENMKNDLKMTRLKVIYGYLNEQGQLILAHYN